MNTVGAIYTMVYQRSTHPAHVTSDNRPSPIRPFPHSVHDPRHGGHGARRCTHPVKLQVGLLHLRRHNSFLRIVSVPALDFIIDVPSHHMSSVFRWSCRGPDHASLQTSHCTVLLHGTPPSFGFFIPFAGACQRVQTPSL